YGGGNQFLLALREEFQRLGLIIENNRISVSTRACLFNSFNFDFDQLRRERHMECRMIHRVDGPITVYRGRDEGIDRQIWRINHELADATIFQSEYSLREHLKMGLEFRNPSVIMNTVDPKIFNTRGKVDFNRERKIRLISTSWSDNPKKGALIYQWLDNHLDWSRYEYRFCGRVNAQFKHIHITPPLPSAGVADVLRQHDIYITASRDDPCSNGLIEALACGLPALYLKSGGHPEIVRNAGLGFETPEEISELLDKLVAEYEERQKMIIIQSISDVARRYLNLMEVEVSNA
ncbi:MAG: glycosyltransferase family 4 protein, partial [Anaerolineales bacterium]|nr:glycosyltransferase family 4 protein [Anaerolineales bacterium]